MIRARRMTDRRRAVAERRGRRAELWAAWFLRLKGYRILASRWRGRSGEVDLIGRRGRVLVFVEVKLRDDPARAAMAAAGRGPARIARAAAEFLATRPELATLDVRFDLMLSSPGRMPRHLPDAWRP